MTKDEVITKIHDIVASGDEFGGAAVKAERIKAIAACAAFFFREPPEDFENVSPYIIALSAFEVIKWLIEYHGGEGLSAYNEGEEYYHGQGVGQGF